MVKYSMYYFDNAATTKISEEVFNAMEPYLKEEYGNPSSIYKLGRKSREAIESSRERISKALNCEPEEIFFTSSGTESNNWAIKGVAYANRKKGNHIITTEIEHHAVLNTCKYLEKQGFEVTYLPVMKNGIVDIEELKKSITEKTILISVMYVNNEIGTIQPIKEISKIAKEKNILLHTDAVQAVGKISVDIQDLGVDLLTLSGHKINAPKGVGCLFVKKGIQIDNLMHGGGQEMRKRAGTENVPYVAGLGKAIEIAESNRNENAKHLKKLQEKTIDGLLKIPNTILNGDRELRVPGNVNVCFEYIEGESILLLLDQLGIAASSGSACTSGSLNPSHVLLALGLPHEIAHGSLRITFAPSNTEEEVEYLLKHLPAIIERLRQMSPLYNK